MADSWWPPLTMKPPSFINPVYSIREVVHCVVWPLSFCKELINLVVSGDSRTAHLDDVHVVPR